MSNSPEIEATSAEESTAVEATPEPVGALADAHRRLGASFGRYRGVASPETYGAEQAEFAALQGGCGVVDSPWLERIEMQGEDRERFLNGLVTCDVKSLQAGEGTYGFVTNVKGRVLADLVVSALDDRLGIELSPGTSQAVTEHLQKYIIIDRVEIVTRPDLVALTLVGPRSSEVLAGVALPEAEYGHVQASLQGLEVHLSRRPALGASATGRIESWVLWVSSDNATDVLDALLEGGAQPVGHRALDRLRVAAGRSLFGLDFSSANFPQETGLEDEAVSYTKGCYLGQEVVARIHYRGGVNRHLRRLEFPASDDDTSRFLGRSLQVDGRAVGQVTSVGESEDGQRVGLAILHQRAEPDAEIEVEGGGRARVVELQPDAAD